jgi:putative ABC transport system permease protein
MELRESLKVALGTLRAHKLRASLTALGIIIGVAAVIGLLAIVAGIRDSVARQFSSLGAEMISINRFQWGAQNDEQDYSKRKPLTLLEYETVKGLSTVDAASPTVYTRQELRFHNNRMGYVLVCGTDDVYPAIENWTVKEGRFFSTDDVRAVRQVIVLGADVASNFFPGGGGLDQEVRLGGHHYRVIGILEKKGSVFGESQDEIVNVPYTTFAKHWGISSRRDVNISALAARGRTMQDAIGDIRGALRRVRKVPESSPDDFAINTSDQLIKQFNGITQGFFMVMILVGGMSLLVGGIGIMNIMLVSVTERTREIGIRKAIGARSRDIVRQFLIEAIILCLLGGLVGIALGLGLAGLVSHLTPLPAHVTPFSIILGFGVSTLVGLVFGLWPAVRAAKLDPVESLRYE